jgi:hypothetical protein
MEPLELAATKNWSEVNVLVFAGLRENKTKLVLGVPLPVMVALIAVLLLYCALRLAVTPELY